MTVLRPQIAFHVALTIIIRYARIGHQLVLPVAGDVFEFWQRGRLFLAHVDEKGEQASLGIVEFPDHCQLTERLHPSVSPQVFHDALYLLGREEGQFLQLLACHLIDVHRMLFQFAEQVIRLFPRR